jgi:Niemann-Pick C1 protein
MYDICGAREDGKVVNCPFGSPSVKVSGFFFIFYFLILKTWMQHFAIVPEYASTCFFFFFFFFFLFIYQPDDLLSQKIQSLCPTITGNVCCSEAQFETLRSQVQQVRRLSGNKIEYMCTCLRSFLSVLFMFCRQFHFWSAVLHV